MPEPLFTPVPQYDTTSRRSSLSLDVDVFTWNPQVPNLDLLSPTDLDAQSPFRSKMSERDSMATDPESIKEDLVEWQPRRPELLVMFTLAIISLMVALDASILVPVLPTLAIELHGTAAQAFWAGSSYLLANAVFQPFIAALSDIFGRRELVYFSLFFFTIGSILCGVAQNFTQLLAGRVTQGIGGGGVITLAQVIYADIVPLRQRPKYFTIVLAAWALGTVTGPLLGGVFVQKATWRWCFYINLPFCAVGFAMVFLCLKFSTEYTSLKAKIARVDWLGGFLFISSLTSFLIAISWGGVEFSWTSYKTMVPLVLGIAGVVATLAWERYGAREPFLKKSLFTEWSGIAAYLCALFQGLIMLMALYYLPFYFTAVRFKSPIKSGLGILPACCFTLPGSAIVSALITRLGKFRWAIWSGWALSTIGSGLFILLDTNTKTAVWAIAEVIFGTGLGMVLSSVNFAIQAVVKSEDSGRAASMYAFMRTLGMTIGVAIGGSVMQNFMRHKLQQQGFPAAIARDAEAYVAKLRKLGPDDPERIGVLHGYVAGFQGVFTVMTAICGLALLVSLAIKHYDLNRLLVSKHKLER